MVCYTVRTDRHNTEKTNAFSDLKIFLTSSSNSSFPIYNLTEIPMKIQQKVKTVLSQNLDWKGNYEPEKNR